MKARRLQCFCMTQAKTPEMSLARPRCSARFPNLLYRGFLTRKRFAASKASELATVLPIGNRRYGRFGNLYVQRALNRYARRLGSFHGLAGNNMPNAVPAITSLWWSRAPRKTRNHGKTLAQSGPGREVETFRSFHSAKKKKVTASNRPDSWRFQPNRRLGMHPAH